MDKSLLPALRRHAMRIVKRASKPGGMLDNDQFTMGVARGQLEEAMGFEEGELGGKWKGTVKMIVTEALDKVTEETSEPELERPKDGHSRSSPSSSGSPPPKKKSKANSGPVNKKDKINKRALPTPSPSLEQESEEDGEDEEDGSSNDGFHEVMEPSDPKRGQKRGTTSRTASTSVKMSTLPVISDEEEEIKEEEPQLLDDNSDMSSVYDVPPSRSRKSSNGADAKSSKKVTKSTSVASRDEERPRKGKINKRKKKDPNEGLSPDEAKIADLKRIVVACGVRKQWSKELADCTTESSQISHLKRLLTDLGMKGTPTLGKAKSLKEKRDLAQELDEVKEFEAARGLSSNGRASRSRGTIQKSRSVSRVMDPDEDESGASEDVGPDKERSALGAVMDFLGEESESE